MNSGVVVVTGAAGFVGRYLLLHLAERGYTPVGIDRVACRIGAAEVLGVDILSRDSLSSMFRDVQPQFVYHLAAVASPKEAQLEPQTALRVNVEGSLNVLAALEGLPDCRMLQIGTSHEYAVGSGSNIVHSEDDALGAESVYGMTKELSERLLRSHAKRTGQQAFFTRSFNHTGPGQSDLYAVGNFVKQAVAFAKGTRTEIEVGDISVERDLLDVRDVVKAYVAILERGRPLIPYNVCSGSATRLELLLKWATDAAGCADAPVVPRGVGSGTPRSLRGLNARLKSDTGWHPQITLVQTVNDMVEAESERMMR